MSQCCCRFLRCRCRCYARLVHLCAKFFIVVLIHRNFRMLLSTTDEKFQVSRRPLEGRLSIFVGEAVVLHDNVAHNGSCKIAAVNMKPTTNHGDRNWAVGTYRIKDNASALLMLDYERSTCKDCRLWSLCPTRGPPPPLQDQRVSWTQHSSHCGEEGAALADRHGSERD